MCVRACVCVKARLCVHVMASLDGDDSCYSAGICTMCGSQRTSVSQFSPFGAWGLNSGCQAWLRFVCPQSHCNDLDQGGGRAWI